MHCMTRTFALHEEVRNTIIPAEVPLHIVSVLQALNELQ